MTTPVIDLTKSQSDSNNLNNHNNNNSSTTTTSKHHISNPSTSHRLDKQGSRLYNLENLNITHKVSQAVDEIVTDAKSLELDYSNSRSSRLGGARKRDERDVTYQELLLGLHLHRHHLYLLQQAKSVELDYSNQRLADQEEARASGAPADIPGAQELSLTDYQMQDDSIPEEQNNWASALVSISKTPAENSLLAKTGDMTTFMKWYFRQVNKTKLTQAEFDGQAYEVVKAFYPDVIHLQFQMEECHKMLTDQIDWTNPEGDQVRVDVNQPLPLGGPPDMILRRIEKMSDYTCRFLVSLESKHTQDTDLNLILLQDHLDHLPGSDKRMLSTADATGYEFKHDYTIIESPRAIVFPVNNNERKIMRFNKIYKFSDGTLTRILEALDYRVKEFKVKRLNPDFFRERNDIVIPIKRGIVRTEMELVLEHTQQGTSNEISVSTEGVEELKRNVKIKGEKKAALL
ncbi:hypothetical protein Tco_1146874 [Tanacetum coccineum]